MPRLPRHAAGVEPHSDDLDEVSLAETAVNLDLHCQAVAARARSIAERLGIPADLAEVVERAGRLHDIGKADRRFQRWLDPDEKHGGVRVAKSNMPRNLWDKARAAAGWPRGGRHEELSARLVRQWLECHPAWCDPSLRDLLLHLIVSHHGSGRPLVPPVADYTTDMVSGVVGTHLSRLRPTSPSSTGSSLPVSGNSAIGSGRGDWRCSRLSSVRPTMRFPPAPR